MRLGWRRTPKGEELTELKQLVKLIRSGTVSQAAWALSKVLDKVHDRAASEGAGKGIQEIQDRYHPDVY
jgi:hypothetical protein